MMSSRLNGFDNPTVWHEFTPLANKHKAENLGQGFPDWETPRFVKDAMINAVNNNHNQYCRAGGDIALVEAISKHYGPRIGRSIDPLTEITVCVGATEALFAVMQAMINIGDEVILLEPAFDIYPAQVQMAGGESKYVPLRINASNGKWELSMDELESSITTKTKIILINTPHNPTGKVFTLDELNAIADIARRHPHVTIVTDEVYEHLVYDGRQHVHLASLPDMWDRVITVSSSGKTFSCTGWKVGWVYGAAQLIKPIMLTNQWVQFSVSTPTQRALAEVLQKAEEPYDGFESYFKYVNDLYQRKRDFLAASLSVAKLSPYLPEGGFFIMADTSAYSFPVEYLLTPGPDGASPVTRDWGFARWLTTEIGVTPIPPSAFYTQAHKSYAENLARFALCKTDECLEAARKKLLKLLS